MTDTKACNVEMNNTLENRTLVVQCNCHHIACAFTQRCDTLYTLESFELDGESHNVASPTETPAETRSEYTF